MMDNNCVGEFVWGCGGKQSKMKVRGRDGRG